MDKPPLSPVADSSGAHEREPAGTYQDNSGLGIPPSNRWFTETLLSPMFRLGSAKGPWS